MDRAAAVNQQDTPRERDTEPDGQAPPYGPRSPERLGAWIPPAQRIGPSLTWLLVGGVAAALVGWLGVFAATELMGTEAEQLRRVYSEAALQAYEEAYEPALAAAYEEHINREMVQYLQEDGVSRESAWGREFQRGWIDGWNEALDAMRSASLEAGLSLDSRELKTLADEPRRNPVP